MMRVNFDQILKISIPMLGVCIASIAFGYSMIYNPTTPVLLKESLAVFLAQAIAGALFFWTSCLVSWFISLNSGAFRGMKLLALVTVVTTSAGFLSVAFMLLSLLGLHIVFTPSTSTATSTTTAGV